MGLKLWIIYWIVVGNNDCRSYCGVFFECNFDFVKFDVMFMYFNLVVVAFFKFDRFVVGYLYEVIGFE